MKSCDFPGCENKHEAKGLCISHYNQLKRTGELKPLNSRKFPILYNATIKEKLKYYSKENRNKPKFKGSYCREWQAGKSQSGYGHIDIPGKGKCRAHRIAYEEYIGEITEENPIIRHLCHNKLCINPFHLKAGTPQDNSNDSKEVNAFPKGENNPYSKLTDIERKEIKRLYSTGKYSQRKLAKKFNVHQVTIGRITRN